MRYIAIINWSNGAFSLVYPNTEASNMATWETLEEAKKVVKSMEIYKQKDIIIFDTWEGVY